MDSNRPARILHRLRDLLAPALAALGLSALAATPAHAEPPMWVVEDPDSTIYIFGTVHLLDPSIQWRTPRVQKALDDATQLWVEVAIPPGGEAAIAMSMLQKAMDPAQTLSSRLTEQERKRLLELLAKSPEGPAMAMIIDRARPWFANMTLGITPLMAAGYESASGADTVLMQVARAQGDEVLGLESAEQQIELISAGTDEEQLAALQRLLAISDEEFDAMARELDAGVRAWMKGDTTALEASTEEWRTGRDDGMSGGLSYQQMMVDRNENWAEQIEALLKGSGIAFVAVGAGHLVGPDSLQRKLAARGIRVRVH